MDVDLEIHVALVEYYKLLGLACSEIHKLSFYQAIHILKRFTQVAKRKENV